MTDIPDAEWLTLDETAERLDVTARELRSLMRDNRLAGRRHEPGGPLLVPADFLQQHDGTWQVLPSLRGTLIQLFDGGFSTGEAVTWLLEEDPQLGCAPLQALHARRIHEVRRVAQALAL